MKTMDHLQRLNAERSELIETLALWDHTALAGFVSKDVKAFSFRPQFLTKEEARKLGRRFGDKSDCKTHFNCVRLKTGDLAEIPLYPRPGARL